MPTKKRTTTAGPSRSDPAVSAFIDELDHPLKEAVADLRAIILAADPAIGEGIKWNAPSFKTTDYFATLNLRGKAGAERLWLILHTGAKPKGLTLQNQIPDPTGLLKWLAKDRALVTFEDAADVAGKKKALAAIIRAWIEQM